MTPAAWGAVAPIGMVHALISFLSGGEVTLEAQQGVGRSRDLVKSRFIHAKISKHLRLGLVVELRKFAFNFRANFDHPSRRCWRRDFEGPRQKANLRQGQTHQRWR